jgi:single-strand DNA-binding protein
MSSLNKVHLIGNVGKDPEVRYSQSGAAVVSISLATSEQWKDKVSGERQEKTEWHRVTFFGRLAEVVGEYVKKGSKLYVEGRLETKKYTDKAGVEKYSTEIIAGEMKMLDRRQDGDDRGQASAAANTYGGPRPPASSVASPGSRHDEPFPDDDIPF